MNIYSKQDLKKYLRDDWVLRELKKYPEDNDFISQKWLLNLPEKRLIYADMYGDLLRSKGKKILDVGGGFCGLSRKLIENHDYTLVDMMTHDDHRKLKTVEENTKKFWINQDWNDFKLKGKYDYVIANDLFPNVDQRLRKFVSMYKSHSKKLVMALTCYENGKQYKVKRMDADEIIIMAPWNAAITSIVLGRKLSPQKPKFSIFKNGRSIYKITI